jgi:hypothetical protein
MLTPDGPPPARRRKVLFCFDPGRDRLRAIAVRDAWEAAGTQHRLTGFVDDPTMTFIPYQRSRPPREQARLLHGVAAVVVLVGRDTAQVPEVVGLLERAARRGCPLVGLRVEVIAAGGITPDQPGKNPLDRVLLRDSTGAEVRASAVYTTHMWQDGAAARHLDRWVADAERVCAERGLVAARS